MGGPVNWPEVHAAPTQSRAGFLEAGGTRSGTCQVITGVSIIAKNLDEIELPIPTLGVVALVARYWSA